MRQYELVLVVQPALEDEQVNAIVSQVADIVQRAGGEILSSGQLVDKKGHVSDTSGGWTKRRLAYPISGRREGFYAVVTLSGPPETIDQIERSARLSEDVLRYLSIRTDEEA